MIQEVFFETVDPNIKIITNKNNDKEMLFLVRDVNSVVKTGILLGELSKGTSKSASSLWNTAMEDFKTGLDSVIDIVEQQEILEHHCVPIDYLVLVNGYDRKDRNWQKFLKPKLTEKYGNPLFVMVQQNKPLWALVEHY